MSGNCPRFHETPPDAPEYVDEWARDIVAALSRREAERLVEDYRGIAENKRVAKADREVAAERAEALEWWL